MEKLKIRRMSLTHSQNSTPSECEVCRDREWVFWKDEAGEMQMRPCICQLKKRAKKFMMLSGISNSYESKSFDNFASDDLKTKTAKETALKYVQDFRGKNLILTGLTGSGKTHLAIAVIKGIIDQGVMAKYVSYRDLVNEIKYSGDQERAKRLKKYTESTILLIDDLYKGKPSDADINALYEVINCRYTKRLGTVITTELSINEINDIESSIAGRLVEYAEGYIVQMSHRNRRLE